MRDRSGAIQARAFQDADALAGRFERGELVRVSGRVERFRDQPVLEVVDIARVDAGFGFCRRPGRSSSRPPTGTSTSSTGSSSISPARCTTGRYRAFLEALLGDAELRAEWRRAPCTRGGHHAYLGGLLEHTVAVATLALEVCQLHPRLNPDLLLTAAITHDLGRTREFAYGAEIGLTDEGRLLGHLVLGEQIVSARAGPLDDERRLALLHCVLCHHGAAAAPGGRFGSVEALTLYRLNALDAGVKGAFEHGLGLGPPRGRTRTMVH